MFNSINNPFGNQRVTSSASSDSNSHHQNQNQKQDEGRNLLEENEQDEVKLGGMPILSEDEILDMVKSYIAKLKDENSDNEKVVKKLDKYLSNFNIKKFMKQNPNMTSPDFHMIMFNETSGLLN